METANGVVLVIIAILAIINLVKEIEIGKETLREMIHKLIFGGIAAGALFAVFYASTVCYFIMNLGFLVMLADRLKSIKTSK